MKNIAEITLNFVALTLLAADVVAVALLSLASVRVD